MITLYNLSQAISILNKEKKFAEALKYFKENKTGFTPEQIALNSFVVDGVLTALIELNYYDAVFIFIQKYKVILDPKNFAFLLKRVKHKTTPNWIFISKFCDLVSVESLSTECKKGEVEVKGQKKETEFASNKEDWYAIKTKALFETKHYAECFELSKEALHAFDTFHYTNDVWFARRIALCKKNLGKPDEAIAELQHVLRRKKEWYIQKELADLFFEKGEADKAFKLSIDAVNNFGDLDYKIDLLVLLGKLLELRNEVDLAFKHYNLSKLLRLREDENKIKWSIPFELSNKLKDLGFQEAPLEKLSQLKRELKKYWESFKPLLPYTKPNGLVGNQLLIGKVDSIINDNEKGKAGFIKTTDGKRFYFAVNLNEEFCSNIKAGLPVEFKTKPVEGKNDKAVQLKAYNPPPE